MLPQQKHHQRCTTVDFIHYCLSETSKLLTHAIAYTYNQESHINQRKFYLVGYKPRKDGYHQRRLYGDPSKKQEGSDIKWQLKHLRWHMGDYADHMNVYKDVLDDITGFLLFDIVHQSYLGSQKLSDSLLDKQFLYDCIEACEELVNAIQESSFYASICTIAKETSKRIELLSSAASKDQDSKGSNIDFDRDNKLPNSTGDSGIFTSDVRIISTPARGYVSSINSSLPLDSSMVIVDTPVVRNKTIALLRESELKNSDKRKRDNVDEIDGSFVLI